jgi:ABC-type glycerol-3-phosphate transport system substrate-binding protein
VRGTDCASAIGDVPDSFSISVGGKAAATKTLSFWQFYAPTRQPSNESKWFEDCVKGWNATHDVKVELHFVHANEYFGGSKLQTAFASGQGPDIFIISPGDFLRYYNGGVLVDLTSYMEDAAKKDFFPNVMETRIVDEKIYGVPFDVVPLAMFYSLKAFEEAGLSESDIPKTWDQFLEIAHKLTKGDRFGCLFETAPGYYQNFNWYPFMWQGGGDIATPDGKHSAFASPATVQALKFWQDTIQQKVAPRKILGGAMRQNGIFSAAALYGLDHHLQRLSEDHANARAFAERVKAGAPVQLELASVQTNIVVFHLPDSVPIDAPILSARARERGVLLNAMGARTMRAVTHLDVSREQCEAAARLLLELLGR